MPFVNAPMMMLLTLRTPPALRGKVMTATSTAEQTTGPVGYAPTGPAIACLGLGGAYVLVAAGISAAIALPVWTVLRADRLDTVAA